MVRVLVLALGMTLALWGSRAAAQELVWVQIEARPTEPLAIERAELYARQLPNVQGYALPSGWFAIALGPYDPVTAEAELRRLRATGAIPSDSFISDGGGFERRYFGDDILAVATPSPETPPPLPLVPAEETPAEARAAESLLTRAERAEVQEALAWEGFYRAAIDADFGPGTRRAMEAWQSANGFEVTGVLSTAQRRGLIEGYREERARFGFEPVRDDRAGVEVTLPAGLLRFDRLEAPFSIWEAADGGPARLLLISQSGDREALGSLYEVMQTLEIVPANGPRSLGRGGFEIEGANDEIATSVYAELADGAIKGFALVWPAADRETGNRIAQTLRASFRPTSGVLPDDAAPLSADRRRDLVAGFAVRRPERTGSGFFVDGTGRVLTAAANVAGCGRVTIDNEIDSRILAENGQLALLAPLAPAAPIAHAAFSATMPRLETEVSVAGFSFGGALSLPTLTFGALADARGLSGEEGIARLALAAEAGDAGGPVFDATGAVMGTLLPASTDGSRQLPPGVSFAADGAAVLDFLTANGVTPRLATEVGAMAPEDLGVLAADMTVLVSCWN